MHGAEAGRVEDVAIERPDLARIGAGDGDSFHPPLRDGRRVGCGISAVDRGEDVHAVTCVPLPDVETRNNPNFKG